MTKVHPTAAILFATAAIACGGRALAEALPPEAAQMLAGRGDILPLAEVTRRLAIDGEIIGVVLHKEGGRYLYKIKVIGQGGQYRVYEADAKTGTSSGQ
jgi:hypothetical protein